MTSVFTHLVGLFKVFDSLQGIILGCRFPGPLLELPIFCFLQVQLLWIKGFFGLRSGEEGSVPSKAFPAGHKFFIQHLVASGKQYFATLLFTLYSI